MPRFYYYKSTPVLRVLLMFFAIGMSCGATSAENDPIDFAQFENYAVFSEAAYLPESQVEEIIRSQGYSLTRHSDIAGLAVTYYLLTNDKTQSQVISVRGTANIANTLLDMDAKLVTDSHAGIRLHRGFSMAAQKIYEQVKPLLKPDYTVSTTGHSLGGAVALVLAMYLDLDEGSIDKVVTFGQPKVTNVAGADKFAHLDVYRLVTPEDIVPLVPPLDAMDINDLDIYWHLGKEVILLADKRYAILEGLASMMRVANFTQQPLTESNLQNHQMSRYRSLLESKIDGADRVSYEIDLNLFNLFSGEKETQPQQ
ncbi:lipase family protein [Thiohalophilus sp.]|uniref:lipase family protein n=1 Tax=Thiohalophilus sp. TaxID=3028392 RepID=UPI002ACDD2D1|nr:lipase family protein [Thiohalophilus sp.]MDZ7805362.1 lipase family protein [Thiohalophilus sp.]